MMILTILLLVLGECIKIAAPTNVGDSIDLYRGPTSPADDVWKGTYLIYATLPIFIKANETRLAEFSMDVECVDSTGGLRAAAVAPTCSFEVQLTYFDIDNTFRSGTFFASGEYSTEYTISGGTDSFNFASGTLTALFDSNDSYWYKGIEIDMCIVYPEVGDAVQCLGDTDGPDVPDTSIYRMTSSTEIQHYSNEVAAFSWTDEWHVNTKHIDCTGMTIGDDVAMKPSGLFDGKTVFCIDSTVASANGRSGYYHWMDFHLREYTSGEIADSWDSKWTLAQRIDCTGLSVGEDMPLKPNVPENESIHCANNTDGSNEPVRVYRYIDGRIRYYPHPIIAHSWDYDWNFNPVASIDCTGITIGKVMSKAIVGTKEGDIIKCSDNSDLSDNPNKLYRYSHAGILRYFPDPTTAFSWDALWHQKIKGIDCSGIPHIDNMPLKSSS